METRATDDVGLSPLPRRGSAVEHATVEIRRAIYDGHLAPGDELAIGELSRDLGISAIPVREALRALASEGLVALRPNRKAVVADISAQELRDIFRARRLFETDLVISASPLQTPEMLEDLRRLAAGLADDLPQDARRALHSDFHAGLIAPAASAFDRKLLRVMWDATDRYLRIMLATHDGPRLRRSHLALLDAVATADAETVEAAMDEHFDAGLHTIEAALQEHSPARER